MKGLVIAISALRLAILLLIVIVVLFGREQTLEFIGLEEPVYERICEPTVKIVAEGVSVTGLPLKISGSGVIVLRQGYIHFVLTANHLRVVEDLTFSVEYANGTRRSIAKIFGYDEELDCLLLSFVADRQIRAAEFADSFPKIGRETYCYGHGSPKGPFITEGIVSRLASEWDDAPWMQIVSSPAWMGCSGGGVFDSNGRYIGMIQRIRIASGFTPLPWQCGVLPVEKVRGFLEEHGL